MVNRRTEKIVDPAGLAADAAFTGSYRAIVSTLTGAAIQSAIDAASAAGGGAVYLIAGTYAISAPIELADNVAIIGAGMEATTLQLAASADCYVMVPASETDGTDYTTLKGFSVDGNRANQTADGTHNGLQLTRCRNLTVEDVRVYDCDGIGLRVWGNTQVTKPVRLTNVEAETNAGFGVVVGSTVRHVTYTNVRARYNDGGGIQLDHSQATVNNLWAEYNHGDGIYIHNVQGCIYQGFHAVYNDGYGIFVESLAGSTGGDWLAAMNCQDMTTADTAASSYRSSAASAEIFFDNENASYGINQRTIIDRINVVGDKTFYGALSDNRAADWGVWIDDSCTEDLELNGIFWGDGGLTGNVRLPRVAAADSLRVTAIETGVGNVVLRDSRYKRGQGRVALWLPGTTGVDIRTPDSAAFTPSTSIGVRCKVTPPDWSPGTARTVIGQWDTTSNQRAWRFLLPNLVAQNMRVEWSTDGTSAGGSTITQPADDTNTDGVAGYVGFDFVLSTGQVTFYASTDGENWDAQTLPSAVGATSIFGSSAPLIFGGFVVGSGATWIGSLHWAEVYVDGSLVARPDCTLGVSPFRDSLGNIWTATGSGWAWQPHQQ